MPESPDRLRLRKAPLSETAYTTKSNGNTSISERAALEQAAIEQMGNRTRPLPERRPQQVATAVSLQPVIRKWWWWYLLAGIISAPIAFFVGTNFASETFAYQTQLMFNRSHFGAPIYEAPDMYALASLGTSPGMLWTLKEDLELDIEVPGLEKLIKADVKNGASILTVDVDWESGEGAKRILEKMNSMLIKRVETLRNERVDDALVRLNTEFEKIDNQVEEAHQKILSFREEHSTFGVAEHVKSLASEHAMLHKELLVANSERDALEVQVEEIQALEMVENESETTSEEDREDPEAKYAAMLDQIQKERLAQTIQEEKQRAILQAQLDAKVRELAQARNLYYQKLVPMAEVQKIQDEAKLLQLQLDGTASVQQKQNELDDVSSRVDKHLLDAVLEGKVSMGVLKGANAFDSLSEYRENSELGLATKENLVKRLDNLLEKHKEDRARLKALLPESERLIRNHDRIEVSRKKLAGQIHDLNGLRRSDASLFTVLDPPAPAAISIKSNKKKLMVAIYVLCAGLLCGPVMIRELLTPAVAPDDGSQSLTRRATESRRLPR